jgi:hypothetical protein
MRVAHLLITSRTQTSQLISYHFLPAGLNLKRKGKKGEKFSENPEKFPAEFSEYFRRPFNGLPSLIFPGDVRGIFWRNSQRNLRRIPARFLHAEPAMKIRWNLRRKGYAFFGAYSAGTLRIIPADPLVLISR